MKQNQTSLGRGAQCTQNLLSNASDQLMPLQLVGQAHHTLPWQCTPQVQWRPVCLFWCNCCISFHGTLVSQLVMLCTSDGCGQPSHSSSMCVKRPRWDRSSCPFNGFLVP